MSDVQSNAVKLGTQPVGKLLVQYSIPAIVGMIVVSLYNIVDRVFIGQGVGSMAISGLALTFPLMTLVAAIGTLVGIGASARISIVLGMRDIRWARNILGNAFWLTFMLSILLVTPAIIFMDEILIKFGGSEQTIPYAKEYLYIVIPGSVLTNLTFSFGGMMRAAGFPAKSMIANVIGMVSNVILDPIFIFGFNMGIKGAAVATVISMFISSIYVMNHFFNKQNEVHFEREGFRLKKRIVRNIISIGMAPFLMNIAASGVNIVMNHQLKSTGGDLAIGAYGIVSSYAVLAVMAVMGLCQGMQPIVGYNYGARKIKRVKDTVKMVIRTACIIMAVGFIIGELFPGILVSAFTQEPELAEMTRRGLRIVFLAFPVVGFQIVVAQFFQAISRPKEAIFMSLSRQVVFLIPLLYLFGSIWDLKGVWFAIPASDLVAALVAAIFLGRAIRIFYPRAPLHFRKTT